MKKSSYPKCNETYEPNYYKIIYENKINLALQRLPVLGPLSKKRKYWNLANIYDIEVKVMIFTFINLDATIYKKQIFESIIAKDMKKI